MATLGPQIVTGSYGNLLKFIDVGEDGVETGQIRISDGKGKQTPLFLATGSAYVSGALSASAEVVFSGLTSNAPGQYVSFDTTTGRLYYSNTSSIVPTNALNATSASYAVTASYAVSAAFAPNDGDWTIGATFMTASGQNSIVIGNKLENGLRNYAQGGWSHAEGADTVASGSYSHAEGRNTSASGEWSHAEGNETLTKANYTHAEGSNTIAHGGGSHAEGSGSISSGSYSHAEGLRSIARGIESHAEGADTLALGNYSHAEGRNTSASGDWSHAEGNETKAVGNFSHAEGYQSHASGEYSHAEGGNGSSQGDYSHAGGLRSTARYDHQTVVGHYNDPTGQDKPDDVFVVGVGTDTNDRQSGLRVRKPEGKVILNQNTVDFNFVFQSSTQQWEEENIPGLYFGEPEVAKATRIVSFYDPSSGFPLYTEQGRIYMQVWNDGLGRYQTMTQQGPNAQFVPD